MTAIQTLRAKAKAADNLKSGSQITVAQKSLQVIVIQPTNPQIVYAQQEDPSGVQQDRYQWCGLAYFPAYRGNDTGGDGTTPVHHPGLPTTQQPAVTNKYLQATSKAKRLAQDKLVDAILPTGLLPAPKLIQ